LAQRPDVRFERKQKDQANKVEQETSSQTTWLQRAAGDCGAHIFGSTLASPMTSLRKARLQNAGQHQAHQTCNPQPPLPDRKGKTSLESCTSKLTAKQVPASNQAAWEEKRDLGLREKAHARILQYSVEPRTDYVQVGLPSSAQNPTLPAGPSLSAKRLHCQGTAYYTTVALPGHPLWQKS
jgi:hypothetical protein